MGGVLVDAQCWWGARGFPAVAGVAWLRAGAGDEVAVAHGVVGGGKLEHAVEDESSTAGSAAVETEHELAQIALKVGLVDGPLVGSE